MLQSCLEFLLPVFANIYLLLPSHLFTSYFSSVKEWLRNAQRIHNLLTWKPLIIHVLINPRPRMRLCKWIKHGGIPQGLVAIEGGSHVSKYVPWDRGGVHVGSRAWPWALQPWVTQFQPCPLTSIRTWMFILSTVVSCPQKDVGAGSWPRGSQGCCGASACPALAFAACLAGTEQWDSAGLQCQGPRAASPGRQRPLRRRWELPRRQSLAWAKQQFQDFTFSFSFLLG